MAEPQTTVVSKKLEHGCRMIYDGFPFFFGLGLEDGHVPTFWRLLYLLKLEPEHTQAAVKTRANQCLVNTRGPNSESWVNMSFRVYHLLGQKKLEFQTKHSWLGRGPVAGVT